MSVFIDSSALIAYYNAGDEHHERAAIVLKKVFDDEYGLVYTSDYILDESVTVIWLRTKSKETAINLGEHLLYSKINILNITANVLATTWDLYKKLNNPSFTDCTTLTLMHENNIQNIVTFDKWFEKIKGIKMLC